MGSFTGCHGLVAEERSDAAEALKLSVRSSNLQCFDHRQQSLEKAQVAPSASERPHSPENGQKGRVGGPGLSVFLLFFLALDHGLADQHRAALELV
ncbi:MAG: hypothetical protein ABI409_15460, partial [Ramlibacter sp.]